jgi:hypothetical protein
MRNSVIAIVLCVLAAAAGARCVEQALAPGVEQAGGAVMTKASATTAAAGTQQELPMDDGPPVTRASAPQEESDEQQPRGTGTAMVLAAVAVMSGIALRRYGSRMR